MKKAPIRNLLRIRISSPALVNIYLTVDNQVVSLTFTQFHLEEDAGCGYDWLAVYDGPSARAAQLGRYCGTQLPGDNGTLVATRNIVTMEFR